MTKFDLFDSIGEVDDEIIEKAKQPIKNHRKLFITISSVAACAIFACAGVLYCYHTGTPKNIYSGTSSAVTSEKTDNGITGGTSSESPVLEDSAEVSPEEMYFKVYYVNNGKIEYKTTKTSVSAKNVFEIWKKENHIGEEVKLINSKSSYENFEESEYEYSGAGVVKHETGGQTIYTLEITKNIEAYYEDISSDILLESLRKTMTGMEETPPDDYDLVLVDESEQFFDDASESNQIGSDDFQYNDRGEILE